MANKVFADLAKVHRIDHTGKYYASSWRWFGLATSFAGPQGWSAGLVAGDGDAVHDTVLVGVVVDGEVHDTTVVPHHHVTR